MDTNRLIEVYRKLGKVTKDVVHSGNSVLTKIHTIQASQILKT